MIYSTGVARATVNDKVVHDSSWDLKSMDDDEFEMKLNMNGKRYEIRDFTWEDLGQILQHPHTTDDLGKEGLLTIPLNETPGVTRVKPYPRYSYRLSRSNKRRSPKKKKVSSLRRSKSSRSSRSSKSTKVVPRSNTPKRSLKKKKVLRSGKSSSKSTTKPLSKASVSKKTIY